jgi:hypothetical protein
LKDNPETKATRTRPEANIKEHEEGVIKDALTAGIQHPVLLSDLPH